MTKWIKQFLLAGLAGLIRPKHNQKYSLKTKIAAVKDYQLNGLASREVLIKYKIRHISQLKQWIIQYNSDKLTVAYATRKRVTNCVRKKISRNTQSGGASTGQYQAIQEMIKDGYTVSELVKAAKVSRQAYYKWLKRELTTKDIQDQEILNLIKEIEKTNKQSIGYGKMTRLIKRAGLGYLVNKKRVIRIMKEHGIKADYRQAKRKRDKERQTYQAENILNRQFKQEAANQVWVTDTTELAYNIHNYKVRLHVVLDLYGQFPITWLITPTETSEGAIQVFKKAQKQEGVLAPLIHTDRGAAYTSKAFNQYLTSNNSQHSYSAPGTPADNAVIEHWWADFKAIWLAHSSKPQTLDELQTLVAEGIEYFTNTFISAKRNDLTATEFRYGKAN